jgi:hypothetical protein
MESITTNNKLDDQKIINLIRKKETFTIFPDYYIEDEPDAQDIIDKLQELIKAENLTCKYQSIMPMCLANVAMMFLSSCETKRQNEQKDKVDDMNYDYVIRFDIRSFWITVEYIDHNSNIEDDDNQKELSGFFRALSQ